MHSMNSLSSFVLCAGKIWNAVKINRWKKKWITRVVTRRIIDLIRLSNIVAILLSLRLVHLYKIQYVTGLTFHTNVIFTPSVHVHKLTHRHVGHVHIHSLTVFSQAHWRQLISLVSLEIATVCKLTDVTNTFHER